jgi:SprT protein
VCGQGASIAAGNIAVEWTDHGIATMEGAMDIDDARILARQRMDQHGLHRWSRVFGQAQTYFGLCDKRQQRITISAPLTLLNNLEEVREVMLHEIAHATTTDPGHGRLWQAQARLLGCRPERCYHQVRQPPPPFVGTCPGCGAETTAYRRRRVSCGRCDATFNPAYLLVWTRKESPPRDAQRRSHLHRPVDHKGWPRLSKLTDHQT